MVLPQSSNASATFAVPEDVLAAWYGTVYVGDQECILWAVGRLYICAVFCGTKMHGIQILWNLSSGSKPSAHVPPAGMVS